jgi:hypothetical protein
MKKYNTSPQEVYKIIESFIDGSIGDWDWSDFLETPIEDPYLNEIRKKCDNLSVEYPSNNPNEYCNEEGLKILKQFLSDLKSKMIRNQ